MSEIVKQFLKVQNFNNWTDDKKNEVNENGQIVFVPGATRSDVVDVNAIYANGDVFGDGALSEKVITTSDIMVDGGPLATTDIKEKFPNGIPAGTNLEALLMSLFCKILYPTADRSNISVSASFNLPPVTIITKNMNSAPINEGTYEVGTIINTDNITDKNYTVSLPTRKVTGMKYGFTIGEVNYDSTSYEKSWVDNTSNVNYSKTADFTGWATKPSVDNAFSAYAFVMAPGNNIITINNTATGSFNATVEAIPDLQMYTNAGTQPDVDEDNKSGLVSGYNSNTTVTKTELSNRAFKKFVGAYPVLLNGLLYSDNNGDGSEISTATTPTSDTLVKHSSVWTGSKTFYAKFAKQDEISWKIAIPDYYTNASITSYAFDGLVSKKYDIKCTFTKTDRTISYTCGNVGDNYSCHIWECTGTSGANGVKLIIDLK